MTLTDIHGAPVRKPFSWSYSKLGSFRTCGTKYYHEQVKKDYPEKSNDNMMWGNRVHAAMAARVAHSSPLPEGMQQWEPWIEWVLNPPSPLIRVEYRMAITNKLQPCGYFDKVVNPWFRTVADVLKVNGPAARLIDYKTGKVKEDSDQLALGAAVVMIYFPEVQVVKSQFVFLKDGVQMEETYTRNDIPRIWQRTLPDVIALHKAGETGEWLPKPSGLCKKHCGVLSCAYHGRGAY
jgi:hypothetical protein